MIVDVEEYERLIEIVESMPAGAPAHGSSSRGPAADEGDPVEAYKSGIDRSLLRENLMRPVGERLRRLGELARFAESLRNAERRAATAR